MKLKTAIEYWEFITQPHGEIGHITKTWYLFDEYVIFLKQPLQLGFFVPCDKEGKPLEKPYFYDGYKDNLVSILAWTSVEIDMKACEEYQQACDRVLFKGFELFNDNTVRNTKSNIWITFKDGRAVEINDGYLPCESINDLSGKVDLVEKVAEKYKY